MVINNNPSPLGGEGGAHRVSDGRVRGTRSLRLLHGLFPLTLILSPPGRGNEMQTRQAMPR